MQDKFKETVSGGISYLYEPEKLKVLNDARRDEITRKLINEHKYAYVIAEYKGIINSAAKIIREIGIKNNPTSEFIVYSYLLWKGIFSKDMRYVYDNNNLLNINQLYRLDIINGRGVCKATSELMKEIFKSLGYTPYTIVNSVELYYTDYRVDTDNIDQENPIKEGKTYNEIDLSPSGDHMAILLEKDGNYYIYDPTNIFIFKMDKMLKGDLYNGQGKCHIKPWGLFVFDLLDETKVLKLLDSINKQDTSKFLTDEDITEITLDTLDLCHKSHRLIADYREKITPNINNIARINNMKEGEKDVFVLKRSR